MRSAVAVPYTNDPSDLRPRSSQATGRDQVHDSTRRMVVTFLVFAMSIAVASVALGQGKGKAKEDPKLKLRTVTLKTRDGIALRAFYMPSDKGKEAIPVILVHEWEGQASPYGKLVAALHNAGCAVLVPDYRGHGGSNEYIDGRGKTQTFNLATMNRRDIDAILSADLEEAKQFLKHENDAGNLNLNALVMIGVREGGVLASHFAMRDWRWPSIGSKKQGQDVKALVLISPEKQLKGIGIDPTLMDANVLRLPIMLVAGDTSSEASETIRIAKRIEVFKKKVGQGEVTGLNQQMVKTSLSGPALVNESSEVIPAVVEFVKANVNPSNDVNPWVERN
ncbi:Alpha/beta hydrolase family protein [Novipirellula galeiformis]|uniref:Alpha/beta hydrolase family protein n=2 Tax=Novipirellula galeiformis TaxID=2528004 RepID=A0A5C6CTT9_9BACT|nr:Alpha/beta hydrolase family protein [Novipirellula galeiformis]